MQSLGIDMQGQLGKLMKKIFISVIALGFIAGCSGFGSFGGSDKKNTDVSDEKSKGSSAGFGKRKPKEVLLEQRKVTVDDRILIPVVNDVKIDKFNGGLLIQVIGTTDVQGYGDVDLVPVNKGLPDENGVVTFEFKGDKPEAARKGATVRSQEVYAGASLPAIRLPAVKSILVIAAQNSITLSP